MTSAAVTHPPQSAAMVQASRSRATGPRIIQVRRPKKAAGEVALEVFMRPSLNGVRGSTREAAERRPPDGWVVGVMPITSGGADAAGRYRPPEVVTKSVRKSACSEVGLTFTVWD